jgi:hypothetical protein
MAFFILVMAISVTSVSLIRFSGATGFLWWQFLWWQFPRWLFSDGSFSDVAIQRAATGQWRNGKHHLY